MLQKDYKPSIHLVPECTRQIYNNKPTDIEAEKKANEVVKILAELGMPQNVISAGFLTYAFRDNDLKEKVKEIAGADVLTILYDLDSISIIDKLHEAKNQDLERLRKMLLAVADDIRVVVLKLALQLVAMRSADSIPKEEKRRIALQTRDIFAPLANRLGIAKVKWELEDLALRTLEPTTYKLIASFLSEQRKSRETYIAQIIDKLKSSFRDEGITNINIYGRAKHINSIYAKMKRKNKRLEEIYDLLALRIHVNTVTECYTALSIVHTLWNPIESEFDDYIANPKPNGYQSLHTAVTSLKGKVIEIQIRTNQMHEYAELGVAAHWRYKENKTGDESYFDRQINWLRKILDNKSDGSEELLDEFKAEIKEDRIYVLTPQGNVLDLPDGATALDFAYTIHTELGHKTRGAIVNGTMQPMNHELKTGDKVEILTGAKSTPSRDWLNKSLGYLKTPKARTKVRSFFKKLQRSSAIEEGEAAFSKELQKHGLTLDEKTEKQIVEKFNLKAFEDVFAGIGFGDVQIQPIINQLQANKEAQRTTIDDIGTRLSRIPISSKKKNKHHISIEGINDLLISIASCCSPVSPEPIKGYITKGRGVNVHSERCPNLISMAKSEPDKILPASWSSGQSSFSTKIVISAHDRVHLIQDTIQILTNEHIEIHKANFTKDNDNVVQLSLEISVNNLEHLNRSIEKIKQLRSVIRVQRILK